MSRRKKRRPAENTEVVIRLDSTLFYGVLTIVAVAAVFGIGLWFGKRSSSPATSAPQAGQLQQQTGVVNQVQPVNPGNAPNPQTSGGSQDSQIQRISVPRIGSPPLSRDEVEGNNPHVIVPALSEDNNFDLGNTFADQVASETLTISNPGKSDLKINEVQTSEGLKAQLDSRSVSPGGETTLKLSYDPQKTGAEGLTLGYVLINSNDPEVPKAQFTVTAFVIKRPTSSDSGQ